MPIMCTAELIRLFMLGQRSERAKPAHLSYKSWIQSWKYGMLLLWSDYDYDILFITEYKFTQMEACVIALQNILQHIIFLYTILNPAQVNTLKV